MASINSIQTQTSQQTLACESKKPSCSLIKFGQKVWEIFKRWIGQIKEWVLSFFPKRSEKVILPLVQTGGASTESASFQVKQIEDLFQCILNHTPTTKKELETALKTSPESKIRPFTHNILENKESATLQKFHSMNHIASAKASRLLATADLENGHLILLLDHSKRTAPKWVSFKVDKDLKALEVIKQESALSLGKESGISDALNLRFYQLEKS